MKKFTFKGVLDGFRSTVQPPVRGVDQEIQETLRPENFQLKKTFRHGFPFSPTAIAWDPIQKLLAVGDKSGSLRILGRPGVDAHVKHEGEPGAVTHIQFLINEGALVTATADDCLHLWNFGQKSPQVVHTLKFQREKITCLHLPIQSKWLHVGTERGNVHVVHIETFLLSGYIINWNKAIEPIRSTHPGAVVTITDNPLDPSKLLIAFESGQMAVWDLRTKTAEFRCVSPEPLRHVAWHHEGKQFMSCHTDGSLCTWAVRQPPKPLSVSYPHAKTNKDGKMESCKAIQKVEWKTSKSGECYVIFSGGLPFDKAGRTPSITVINGKTITVLEMEHNVVDFITLCDTPWTADMQDPYAIIVLLQNDLVVIDLQTPGYPCFENPYPMDLHESPVTCCAYFADCPSDLIPAFYSVGRQCNQKRVGFSEKEWPINGGEWAPASCSYNEIILTGHADGSIKFWDASAGTLQILYKLKTAKVFEKPRARSVDGTEEDPLAIQIIALCPESRKMAVAGASGHVIFFKFRKTESSSETHVLEIPVICDLSEDTETSPECEFIPSHRPSIPQDPDKKWGLKVKGNGTVKKPAGFQAALVCLPPAPPRPPDPTSPQQSLVTALTINSSYGLMAFGNEHGIVIVDVVRYIIVWSANSAELYGSQDPYCRSPRRGCPDPIPLHPDAPRSPSIDQVKEDSANEEKSETDAPTESCDQPSTSTSPTMESQASDKKPTNVYDRMHQELRETWKNDFPTEEGSKSARPDNLPLFDEDDRPIRPPRQYKKSKSITANEKRDQRLLSVPNIKYIRQENILKDLRKKDNAQGAGQPSFAGNLMRRFSRVDKLDSSFSRSRSSSMSSLENISTEAIQCLAFADSYTKKSDPSALLPTLWVGTSLGSVLTVMINLPEPDVRNSQPVVISILGGPIFRLKGSILTMSFLDCNGALIPYAYEPWRDENKEGREKRDRTPTKQQSSGSGASSRMSPTPGSSDTGVNIDRQFVVIASEKQARVVALPSQNCVYRQQLVDTDFVVKAEIVSLKDSVCLVCYVSSGHLFAYSLPSLRPLIDINFLPLSELRIARTFCFSNKGHGLYLSSASEVQKFTIDVEFCQSVNEMMGELFLPRDMPEPPKQSFFSGLFGGGARPLDREELFGEGSGKPNKSVAKHIPGSPANLEQLNTRATSATSEVSRAHMLVLERGDKLGQLEDRTERMHNQAQEFGSTAHQLMLKYKDKKWYQL